MNFRNKKFLYIVLTIIVISIFTLTVVYAALSTQLTIAGNADVVGSTWDVHLANTIVTNGSVSDTLPTITNSSNATFNATLNVPGDFYEFTIDVVNDGSIDAMIDSVVKTPELTTEQAKYFNYDVTYHNGESITAKQLVNSGSFVRLKVRLEYKKDLTASDLPTSAVSLSLGFTLVYSQADGSGTDVDNNGIFAINFEVLDKSYSISKEMTWLEWLATPDGISSGIYLDDNCMCDPKMNNLIVDSSGNIIEPTDYITSASFTYSNRISCS